MLVALSDVTSIQKYAKGISKDDMDCYNAILENIGKIMDALVLLSEPKTGQNVSMDDMDDDMDDDSMDDLSDLDFNTVD